MEYAFDSKIISLNSYENIYKRLSNGDVVFTNGCFDLIHPGHIQYLYKASTLGVQLVVGLNSDESIKRLKGLKRPINPFVFRSRVLASFNFIDLIIEFTDDTPIDLIKLIKPKVLVKGSDYCEKEIVGSDVVLDHGGKVVLIDFLEGYSSTSIINKILEL